LLLDSYMMIYARFIVAGQLHDDLGTFYCCWTVT